VENPELRDGWITAKLADPPGYLWVDLKFAMGAVGGEGVAARMMNLLKRRLSRHRL